MKLSTILRALESLDSAAKDPRVPYVIAMDCMKSAANIRVGLDRAGIDIPLTGAAECESTFLPQSTEKPC